jgi:PTS system N-acetylgalactosamine-specific IIA component
MKLGFILTGHANFAPGMHSAIEMIVGQQEAFEVVEFMGDQPLELLKTHMQAAVDELLVNQKCEAVIIFADLIGGMPFRIAMEIAHPQDQIEVVAGVSLSFMVEVVGARLIGSDPLTSIESALESGHQGLQHVRLKDLPTQTDPDPDAGEGI